MYRTKGRLVQIPSSGLLTSGRERISRSAPSLPPAKRDHPCAMPRSACQENLLAHCYGGNGYLTLVARAQKIHRVCDSAWEWNRPRHTGGIGASAVHGERIGRK